MFLLGLDAWVLTGVMKDLSASSMMRAFYKISILLFLKMRVVPCSSQSWPSHSGWRRRAWETIQGEAFVSQGSGGLCACSFVRSFVSSLPPRAGVVRTVHHHRRFHRLNHHQDPWGWRLVIATVGCGLDGDDE